MKSVFGFRVRLGNPDLEFENLNPDFPIERTLSQLYNLFLAVICSLSFNQDFTKEDFEYLVENWETKLDRCGRGDQKWGLFHARK